MTEPPRAAGPGALPPAANRYVATLVLAAAPVLLAAAWLEGADLRELLDPAALCLAALGAASIVFPIRVHLGGDVHGFNLAASVLLAMAMVVPDQGAIVLAALMVAVGYAIATRSIVKTLFNVAQTTLAGAAGLTAGGVVLGGTFQGDVLAPHTLLALLVATTVATAIGVLLVTEHMHRMGGGARRLLLGEVVAPGAWTAVGDFLVAILLTILAVRSPVAIVLAVPMFAGLLLGFRGFAADRETARQAQLLHEASRQLLEGALDERALQEAVDGMRALFGADRSLLVAGGESGPDWVQQVVAEVHRTGEPVLHGDGTSTMAAPVRLEGRVVGVVVVAGRRGVEDWGSADVDLLSTVAGEIAATLRTRRLLGQVQQERSRLAAEKGKLTDVLRSASDGIVVLDVEGRLAACNPAMTAMLGLPTAELGRPWRDVLDLQASDGRPLHEATDDPLGLALSGQGRVERASATLQRPDGERRFLRCSAAPVVSDGVADGVVLVAVDVTRERELEQLRGDFIATVSHELRTPLTPLSGFLKVLREHGATIDDDRRTMMVAAMEKQVGRLSDLIGDLLQVAEMERGIVRVHREVVSLDGAVAEIVELETVAAEERGRVHVDVAGVDVVADPEAVRRILRALVGNAIKHTTGAVTLVVAAEDDAGVVRVRDEGPVIPVSARQTIFEPFRRLGDHLQRTQGPGLGLTVSRALAEALDGSVEVSVAPTGGNEFTLRLPKAGTTPTADLEQRTTRTTGAAEPRG